MDITPAIFDPELGCTSFSVDRITYTRSRSGTTSRTATAQAQGCIHPGTQEMIQLLPEEEKTDQFIVIYTDYALSTGTPETSGANASSIVAAPHSGDGSFQMTSPPTEFLAGAAARSPLKTSTLARFPGVPNPQAALGGSPSFTAPDRIHWNGQTWRVVRVRDWQTFGYYQAYAVLMYE